MKMAFLGEWLGWDGIYQNHRTKCATLGQVKADKGSWKLRRCWTGKAAGRQRGHSRGPEGSQQVTRVWKRAWYPWQQERQ